MFVRQRRRSSNVRAIQLFHELKQQFPTIPDQIVTSCISSYVQSNAQGKKSNLVELIETAIADNKLEQMGRPSQQSEATSSVEGKTKSGNTGSEATPSIDKFPSKSNFQTEQNQTDMNESDSDENRNLVKVSEYNKNVPKTNAAKRPNQLDIKTTTSSGFQGTSEEKRQFNIQLSEKCKDIHKLLNSSDKPPRSPVSAKRLTDKISPTKVESHLASTKRTNDEPPTSQEVQRFLTQDSPTNVIVKKDTCSTPTQTTDTLLGSPNVNVSLNVNCSLDVIQSPSQSRRLSPWTQTPTMSSPRSITSVNFTLRPPNNINSNFQDPLPGSPSSGVTYSTSSIDPQKRIQSRLQITVGPHSGAVSSVRVRPRSFHLPEATQEVVPARAGSLNDLVDNLESPVILKQLSRLERLKAEINNERAKLDVVKKEVAELEKNRLNQERLADRDLERQLLREIRHLRYQCKELESDGEAFYRNIYTGQMGPLTLRQQNRLQYPRTSLFRRPGDEDGPKWNCGSCTFLNHPVLSKCEQCDMPRILHGTTHTTDAVNSYPIFNNLKDFNMNNFDILQATRSLSLIDVPYNNRRQVFENDSQGQQAGRIVTPSRSTPNILDRGKTG